MAVTKGGSFVHQLSPNDHLSPRIHTAKLVYFGTNENPEKIESALRNALVKSIAAFPIIGGSVGLMKGASQIGTLAVQAPFFAAEDILTVKDLRDKYDYGSIRAGNFSPDAVDFSSVVPDFRGNYSRVLLAQANLIRGGLLLTIGLHHNVVDEAGIYSILKLWAAYCRGDDGAALINPEWTDSTAIMIGEGTGILEHHPEYRLKPAEQSATHVKGYQEYISGGTEGTESAVIFFSDEALERVKKAAMKQSTESKANSAEAAQWISTNDALCALIWSRVTAARKLGADVPYSMFNMIVNGRSRLNPPMSPEYIGNVVFVTTKAALPIPLLDSPAANLADTALNIRRSILAIDGKVIKDKIKAVTKVDDIGRLAPGGHSSQFRHLACTSWAGQPYYGLDWGEALGGKIKRLRYPKYLSDGIMVIFPRIPKGDAELGVGGIEVEIGLQKAAVERLRADEAFSQYAQWRS
jgi:hypothetical protein